MIPSFWSAHFCQKEPNVSKFHLNIINIYLLLRLLGCTSLLLSTSEVIGVPLWVWWSLHVGHWLFDYAPRCLVNLEVGKAVENVRFMCPFFVGRFGKKIITGLWGLKMIINQTGGGGSRLGTIIFKPMDDLIEGMIMFEMDSSAYFV